MIFELLIFVTITSIGHCNVDLPRLEAPKAYAPNVPPPITRNHAAVLVLNLNATVVRSKLNNTHDYDFWAFDGHVPGPIIRARVGDRLEVTLTNADLEVPHNIDFHAVSGPGGGGAVLKASPGQTVTASFQLIYPGLFIYHCGVEPAPYHVVNGLYGLILVEPAEGLPEVDREYYVVRSEFYTKTGDSPNLLAPDYDMGKDEKPTHIVFNGRVGSLISEPLTAKTDERVRIYFGNAGPNQVASYHIIGIIFDHVYREGDLISPPARGIQTTLVPAGGSAVVEFRTPVPGAYTMVDHSIFRVLKGATGLLKVDGLARLDIYCPNVLGANATCRKDLAFSPEIDYVNKSVKHNLTQSNSTVSFVSAQRPVITVPPPLNAATEHSTAMATVPEVNLKKTKESNISNTLTNNYVKTKI